ncbi:MAG: hypothetical protein V9E87_07130 [Gemmatimonadales bacterium]
MILVEAKAHFGELSSSCGAGAKSLAVIRGSLDRTKHEFGAPAEADWLNGFYQYANRLAHLAFLRSHGVDAHLVFLYFYGDHDMKGPGSAAEWKAALPKVYQHLGISGDLAKSGVVNVFLPVAGL